MHLLLRNVDGRQLAKQLATEGQSQTKPARGKHWHLSALLINVPSAKLY